MTAICGLLGDGAEGIEAMLAALTDYGADAATWTEGAVSLAVRCAGTGETRAEPGLRVADHAGLTLAADARLDDRATLCAALDVAPPERAAIGDDDLILRAWLRWGRNCPRRLLGDYAFAVWDARERTLFCARDHIGARPFYYALQGERFVLASAVEAVLAAPGVSSALDEVTMACRLAGRLFGGTRTFFASVRKLPPGHTLTIEADAARDGAGRLRTRIGRYWQPERVSEARPASDDACAEEFLELFTQAVDDRVRGPDPVGTHLSGGLDSSGIAVLAARALRRRNRPPPLAFDWSPPVGDAPPEPEHAPEYALVDAVCKQEGLQMFHCALSPDDIVAILRRDGAFPGIHVHMNEEAVQRCAAAQGVRVLLSGWGGDECVSSPGRGHWQHLLLSGRWRRLIAEYRGQDAAALRFLAHIVLPLLHPALLPALHRLRRSGRMRRRGFIEPAFARRMNFRGRVSPQRDIGVRCAQLQSLRHEHLGARIEGWAASGARRGIEYCYPLLDRRLLEFALGLPPEQFRRGRWSRWLMRYGLRTVLPPEVCWNRSKTDPSRSDPRRDAFEEALPAVRAQLAMRTPSRARYVDVPRLLEHLDTVRFRAMPEPGLFRIALQLLDF